MILQLVFNVTVTQFLYHFQIKSQNNLKIIILPSN